MKKRIILPIIAVLVLLASTAMAFNLEINPGSTEDLAGQSSFMVDVIFNPDPGGNTLGTFGFNLFYDNTELMWASATVHRPSPLTPPGFPPAEPFEAIAGNGKIENFSGWLPFGAPEVPINTPMSLATVFFDILDPGINRPNADGVADVWFDITSPGLTVKVDGSFFPISQIETIGEPDVVVTPEPISSILFLTGGATLGLRRFYRRKK